MSIFSKIAEALGGPVKGFVEAVFGGIDSLSTTEEERLRVKAEIMVAQQAFLLELAKVEEQVISEQASIIRTEATGHSWLQRNWRPLVMLLFAYIVAHNYVISPVFGVPSAEMPPDLWTLMKIGLGGYVFGRSVEKSISYWKNGNGK